MVGYSKRILHILQTKYPQTTNTGIPMEGRSTNRRSGESTLDNRQHNCGSNNHLRTAICGRKREPMRERNEKQT